MSEQTLPSQTLWRSHERPADESANFITHGVGFLLSVPAATYLIMLAADHPSRKLQIACGVYGTSLVGLYAASMLSHTFHDPARRRFYRMLDQAFIYLLIAGTFTPWAVSYLHEGWWQALLPGMWIAAMLGAVMTVRTLQLATVPKIAMYVIFGWIPASSIKVVYHAVPPEIGLWMLAGGLFYTFGTVFLLNDHRVRYFHALWHAFVIAGSTCHYLAVILMVMHG